MPRRSTRPPQLRLRKTAISGLSEVRDRRGVLWQVLSSPAHRSLNVAVRLRVPASARWTPAMRLIPGMAAHGCAAVPGMAAFSRHMDALYGARISGVSTRDGRIQQLVWVLRTSPPESLPDGETAYREALRMLRGVILEPWTEGRGYRNDVFIAEREQLQMQVAAEIDDKASYCMQRAMSCSYPKGSPYGLHPSGSPDEIGLVTPSSALSRCRQVLARGDLTVSLFGPVNPDLHLGPVQEAFAGLVRHPAPWNTWLNRPVRHASKPTRRTEHHKTEQAQIALTFSTGINMVHPDWAPVRFATAILGAMNTSRLFTVVRERHGLAYSVGAFLIGQTGMIVMHAGTEGGKLSSARSLMLGELTRLASEGVTEEEFSMARQWLTDITLSSQDSLAARLDGLASFQSCGQVIPVEESIRRLGMVTPAQIRAAAARMRPLAEMAIRPR